jgi:hypothetical protein
LTAGELYDWYVRDDCGGDESDWAGPSSFSTACEAISSFPYTEGFEDAWVGSPAAPQCWSQITVSGTNVWNQSTTTPHSGTYCAKAPWASAGGEHLLITPGLSFGTTDYRLKFWLKGSSSGGTDLKVQIADDNSSAGNFTTELAYYIAGTNMPTTWTEYIIDLSAYEDVQYIAFRMIDDDGYSLYIDDVTVEEIPSCTEPTDLTSTTETTTGADLGWTDASGSHWDLYIVATGDPAPDAGTTPTINDITANPYTWTGGTAATTYDWYARSDCGQDNTDVSPWTGPDSFTTVCEAGIDFSENFDGVTPPAFPNCWGKVGSNGSAYTQVTNPSSSPNCLYLYSSSTSALATVKMPPVTNLGAGTHRLKFNMRAYFSVGGIVEFGYLTDPEDAATFVSLGTATASSLTYTVNTITPASGTYSNYPAIRHTGSPANSLLIDDVIWEEIQAVAPDPATVSFPTDALVTLNNPLISWIPAVTGEPATGYRVYMDGSNPPTTEVYDGTDTEFQTTGLSLGTTYYWKVVPYNATGDAAGVSVWSFTTVSDGYLAESFESTTFPPTGWANPGSWSRSTSQYFAGSASAYKYTSATETLLRTPLVTLTSSSTLDFFAKTTTANTYQRIQVAYSSDGSAWTDIGSEISLPSAGGWVAYSVDLSSLDGNNYYLGIITYNTSSGGSVYVDHIIGPMITPLVPEAVTLVSPADAATNQTATPSLSWTAAATGGVPTGYKIYLDENADPTTLYADVATSPYTVSPALDYSTTYYWKVVAYNGSGDGAASVVRSFTTKADPTLTPPFTEAFGSYPPTNWEEAAGLLAAPVVFSSTTTSSWTADGFANVGSTGAARVEIWSTSTDEWLITPPINLGDGSIDYRLTFDLAITYYSNTNPPATTGTDDKFAVVISTDNGATWTSANTLMLWDNAGSENVYNDISITGETITIELTSYTGNIRLGFYGESTVSNADNNVYVDNVTVEQFSDATLAWYNLQWPGTGIINVAENLTVYSQCWEDGVTGQGTGGGVGIQCWIGYSTDNTNPNTWTNWVETTFNRDAGNNDEYMADLGADQGLTAGTYYYASRYSYLGGPYTYGGYTSTGGGPWDGTTNVSGVLTVNPLVISTFPYSQSFDEVTFAPAGWTNVKTAGTGTPGTWDRVTAGASPTCTPHSGAGMARYNCFNLAGGTKGELTTPSITFPADNYYVSFWMYRDNGYPTYGDEAVNVYYNTSASSSGGTLLGTVHRVIGFSPVVSSEGWYKYTFTMPTGATGSDRYIIFEGVSQYGNNIFVDDVVIDVIPNTYTWSGASDNDWHTLANWDYGVPTASTNVIIPADLINYPTIASAASCNNLTIESSATGTGSLLGQSYLTVSGTTTIERYATAGTWHGISGPLDNDDFNSLYFGGSPNVWAQTYLEASNTYDPVTSLSTDLGDAKGWMVWIGGSTAQTFEFTGNLRSSLTPVNVVNSVPDADHGYNFVGNPYPSAIDWDAATGWTKTNVDAGIWIWTGTNWATYVTGSGGTNGGSQYIALAQGFFVQVNLAQSSGTLGMATDVQVHNDVAYMAPTSLPSDFLKLMVTDGQLTDETIIRIDAAATESYDGQFDMHKMFSWNEEQPQIYSTANNFMAVNVLPEGTVSVPMDVRGVDGNEMTISLEAVSDFDHVYLSDDFTGVQTELTEQPYTFVYDASQTDRFTIYFTIVSTTENTLDNIRVYGFDKQVRLEIPMQVNVNVEVVNMLGQTVRNMDAHMGTTDIHLDHGGYYLVKITGDNQRVTRKVFIR